jgi:hypothetical protein
MQQRIAIDGQQYLLALGFQAQPPLAGHFLM